MKRQHTSVSGEALPFIKDLLIAAPLSFRVGRTRSLAIVIGARIQNCLSLDTATNPPMKITFFTSHTLFLGLRIRSFHKL
jgi:hypothetical protein